MGTGPGGPVAADVRGPGLGRAGLGRAGLRGNGRTRPASGGRSRGDKSLRPDLRTTNYEGGRTSYWQGPEQTRQKAARTVFRALRGSPAFCVSRSKARPQVICPHEICRRMPAGYARSLSALLYDGPSYSRLMGGDWHLSVREPGHPAAAWRKGPVPVCRPFREKL